MPKLNKIFSSRTGRAKAAKQGQAGYDNPRENIDPHIKTQAVSTRELSGSRITGIFYGDGTNLTGTGDNLGNHIATQTISGSNINATGDITAGELTVNNPTTSTILTVDNTNATVDDGYSYMWFKSQKGNIAFRIIADSLGNANYIQSGNYDFTANKPLEFSGYNGNTGSTVTFDFASVNMGTATNGIYTNLGGTGNHYWDYDDTIYIRNTDGGTNTRLTIDATGDFDFQAGDITTTGTVQAEHLYSTDDAVINDKLTVGTSIGVGDTPGTASHFGRIATEIGTLSTNDLVVVSKYWENNNGGTSRAAYFENVYDGGATQSTRNTFGFNAFCYYKGTGGATGNWTAANYAIRSPAGSSGTFSGNFTGVNSAQHQMLGSVHYTGLVKCYNAKLTTAGTSELDNGYGYYVSGFVKGAGTTFTNAYGVYVEDMDEAATNYAIYTNAGLVRFGDDVSSTGDISGATITAGNGWSGTFTNGDGDTVTVSNGIITDVS